MTNNLLRRILHLNSSSEDKILATEIRQLVGRYPKNIDLYKLALTHKSSNPAIKLKSNERLEYLGDALLANYVAIFLYHKYPANHEGFLTKMRAKIVKRKTLNLVADKIGIESLMTRFTDIPITDTMRGNALEALIGAIYIENGDEFTKRFVTKKILLQHIDVHALENINENYKSILLEWCQKNGKKLEYGLIAKYRYKKRDKYKVSAMIDGQNIAYAEDFNKKSAEQKASEKALANLKISTDNSDQSSDL